MPRDQLIDARGELDLRQVAAAGDQDKTSVREGVDEQFGINRRWRDAVFVALNISKGIVSQQRAVASRTQR
jgi:hypothetical protein